MRSISGGKVGIQPDRGRGRAIQNRFGNHSLGFAAKRQIAGGHFIEHDAKGKQIGAPVEVLASHLFGRHIGDRADGGARTGEIRGWPRQPGFENRR